MTEDQNSSPINTLRQRVKDSKRLIPGEYIINENDRDE